MEDTETAERRRIDARALFVFIGAEPHTEWLQGSVAIDDGGYILTGHDAAVTCPSPAASDGSGQERQLLETTWPVCSPPATFAAARHKRVAAAVATRDRHPPGPSDFSAGARRRFGSAQTYISSK